MRSWSGLSVLPTREGHGWNTTVFIWAAHTSPAALSNTTSGCVRALGKVTGSVRIHSGMPLGGFLEKKLSPATVSP
jgi:hypothetical protein